MTKTTRYVVVPYGIVLPLTRRQAKRLLELLNNTTTADEVLNSIYTSLKEKLS
jgi:hypothetical protein